MKKGLSICSNKHVIDYKSDSYGTRCFENCTGIEHQYCFRRGNRRGSSECRT